MRRRLHVRAVAHRSLPAVLALWSLAVAQPLLDLFGKNPEFFVVNELTRLEIVLFAVLVAIGGPVVFLAIEVLADAIDPRAGEGGAPRRGRSPRHRAGVRGPRPAGRGGLGHRVRRRHLRRRHRGLPRGGPAPGPGRAALPRAGPRSSSWPSSSCSPPPPSSSRAAGSAMSRPAWSATPPRSSWCRWTSSRSPHSSGPTGRSTTTASPTSPASPSAPPGTGPPRRCRR